MKSPPLAIIIVLFIITTFALAQEAPRERVLVTRPGNSASFQRHRGQGMPGSGFTFRYRFEGNNGAIHRICERIAAESGDDGGEPIEDGEELPDISVALRLQEELTQAAVAALNSGMASAPISASASVLASAPAGAPEIASAVSQQP